MASGGEEEVVLLVADDDGLGPSSYSPWPSMCLCRICHEEEEESSTTMEIPCACSGTLKYAHRDCIQRWCDEKGSITCEICLQRFEPGYTVPVKKALVEVGVTIRGSLEVPRQNYQPANQGDVDEDDDADYAECSPASQRSASCCQSVAVAFTIILLLRHLVSVITTGSDHYAFSLMTVFVLRASGVLLPFYVVMSAIRGIQQVQRIQLQHQLYEHGDSRPPPVAEPEDERLHQHVIQIQS